MWEISNILCLGRSLFFPMGKKKEGSLANFKKREDVLGLCKSKTKGLEG